jgi:hypothetical protein
MLFIKLSDQTPLPKNGAGKTRTFLFSTDSCLFLHGSVEPYGLFGVQTQFQVHRGGWARSSFNCSMSYFLAINVPFPPAFVGYELLSPEQQ